MLKLKLLLFVLLIVIAFPVSAQYAPDTDGDGVTDDLDLCFLEPGAVEQVGCPPEAFATFSDLDGDGVIDPLDACISDAGDAANAGCPAGVTPDLDYDGLPDSADSCPRIYGLPEDNGCPADDDADFVPNERDACPTQAGGFANIGCPDGVTPPDGDVDGVTDIFDNCPDQMGEVEFGGCPDSDGDTIIDLFDACPDVTGSPDIGGCLPVYETLMPDNRATLGPVNVASITELGRLTVGLPTFSVSGSGLMAVRGLNELLIYDLTRPPLRPLGQPVEIAQTGYPVEMNAAGTLVATYEFPPDFSGPPLINVRDAASGQVVAGYEGGNEMPVAAFAFSPNINLPALAIAYGQPFTQTSVPATININGEDGQTQYYELSLTGAPLHMAFSGDGQRLAVDVWDGSEMTITVWDVSDRSQRNIVNVPLGSLNGLQTPNFEPNVQHFSGLPMALNFDGTRIAFGTPFGAVAIYDISQIAVGSAPTLIATAEPFNVTMSELVSAVAFSPDGSLIAVAGGVPFSGGLTGIERFPIVVLDAATGAELVRLEGHESLIRQGGLRFNQDGTLLISAADATVRLWGIQQ